MEGFYVSLFSQTLLFLKGSFLKLCCFWRGKKKRIVIVFMLKLLFILRKELQILFK